MENALLIDHCGALAEITLNRPAALNALNDAMRARLMAALPGFSRDPDVYAVIVRSSSPRAFCAGGDVRELTALARESSALAAESIGKEYTMNWTLECFSKPTVSLIDGMVMGSGVGLVIYGTHRVAGEKFSFAMPETAIGLFPDVGVGSVLSRMPGHQGRFLGLTGRTIGRAAAYRLGLVTHCIPAEHFPQITAGLEAADTVDPILDGLHVTPSEDDELLQHSALIEELFGGTNIAEIFAALKRRAAGAGADAEWSAEVLAGLKSRSPLSLAVTLRHLDACRDLTLRDVLILDYRLALRFLTGRDFQEGVRALLIDKDNRPKWQHNSIADIQPEEIEAYFAELGAGELKLPSRSEMQQARV